MNIKRFSRRSALGATAILLSILSVSALVLFSQSFTAVTVTNNSNLISNCTSLVDTVTNNGVSGSTEQFTFNYECVSPVINAGSLAFSVAASGSVIPTFSLSTAGSTAHIVSGPTLSIVAAETSFIPGGNTANYGTPHLLTSGTAISLSPGEAITGGFGTRAAEGYIYQVVIVVDSFGTVSLSAGTITWVNA